MSVAAQDVRKAVPNSYVGFDTITKQIESKLVKRGFAFNIMVVGRSGLGKSTMVNTLFATHLVDSKGVSPKQTTEVTTTTASNYCLTLVLEENNVRLKLSITDTPGYGDQVNNEACWEPIIKYIKDQYSLYLRKELTPQREQRIPDTRVHVVLYFIAPTGHALTPLDITVMKKISKFANVVPVIAKSDSLTLEERLAFKKRIKQEVDFHGIKTYPSADMDDEFNIPGSEADRANKAAIQNLKNLIPFAVVGSEKNVADANGKAIRGRRTRSGIINVEDETHCEFAQMRNFLTRTHLQDLIETTAMIHYENFRTRQLLALKESTSMGAKPAEE
ncbi:cell division control protein [Boothiomyces sp. JEL0866]|nr:cell division control protein [Boothiomyces sp. JEL0866]